MMCMNWRQSYYFLCIQGYWHKVAMGTWGGGGEGSIEPYGGEKAQGLYLVEKTALCKLLGIPLSQYSRPWYACNFTQLNFSLTLELLLGVRILSHWHTEQSPTLWHVISVHKTPILESLSPELWLDVKVCNRPLKTGTKSKLQVPQIKVGFGRSWCSWMDSWVVWPAMKLTSSWSQGVCVF